jgi:hypothetical protein
MQPWSNKYLKYKMNEEKNSLCKKKTRETKNQNKLHVSAKNKILITLNENIFLFFLHKTNVEGRGNINKMMRTKEHLFTICKRNDN